MNSIQTLAYSRVTRRKHKNPPVLREEVEETVRSLKAGKSPGVDNIPSELLNHGGETITTDLTAVRKKIWETKERIPLPKKGNLKQCKSHRTASLISHPCKFLLRSILKRLKAKIEELLAEDQGFRPVG